MPGEPPCGDQRHGRGAGAVDKLVLQKQGDDATAEDLAHVLEVRKGDVAETALGVEATSQDDSMDVGMKSLGILLRTGKPGLTHR
jgi:hypothetical protein